MLSTSDDTEAGATICQKSCAENHANTLSSSKESTIEKNLVDNITQ
jgi:hypothetical protein